VRTMRKLDRTPKVADPHHFNADPSPSFHFDAHSDSDPAPHQSSANLPTAGLKTHQGYIARAHAHQRLNFASLKLRNFYFNVDPEPAVHCDADPDPASRKNLNPQPGSNP
jgi:hypothetical protein